MKLEELISSPEETGSVEVNVYHCGLCSLVLAVNPGEIGGFASSRKCPDCNAALDDVVRREVYRLGTTMFLDPRMDDMFQKNVDVLQESRIIEHCSPDGLSSLGLDETSGLTLYSGRGARSRAHFECVTVALDGRKVVFLDGGNSFNVFHLRDPIGLISSDIGAESIVMENILVSRAFNFHQMTRLVTRKLPEALDVYHPSIVVVLEPAVLYEEDDIHEADRREAWYSFKRMIWSLRRLATTRRDVRILIVATDVSTKAGSLLQNISSRRIFFDQQRN